MPEVLFPVTDGQLRGHLALPRGDGPWPGVVVVHDAFGMNDDLRAHTDRLAAAGYVTLAPALFTRGARLRCLRETFRALRAGAGRAFDDIEAARGWLAGRDDCTGRTGVIGFCMGGGFALLCAPRYDFAAASVNYGDVPSDAEEVLVGSCPVVGSFGGRDPTLRGHASRLTSALRANDVPYDVEEYPGAGHSFMDRHNLGPLSPLLKVAGAGYHHPSAEDAWRRVLAFFDEHLRG